MAWLQVGCWGLGQVDEEANPYLRQWAVRRLEERAKPTYHVAVPTWRERPDRRDVVKPSMEAGVSGAGILKAIQGSGDQHSEWSRKEADGSAGLQAPTPLPLEQLSFICFAY